MRTGNSNSLRLAMSFGLAVALVFEVASNVARAELTVCNNTHTPMTFEYSQQDSSCGGGWSDWGWYSIAPCDCFELVGGDVRGKTIHWSAFDEAGHSWEDFASGEVWPVPTDLHADFCASDRNAFCAAGNSCVTRGHWLAFLRWEETWLTIDPSNSFSVFDPCPGNADCVAIQLQCNVE